MSVTAQEREAPPAVPDTGTAQAYAPGAGRLFGPRGRHRRPRSRRALLAAGGLALAAGALSLARLSPDSAVPRLGTADPGGRPGLALGTESEPERATNAAASLPAHRPGTSPSATSAMGGAGASPATGSIPVPTTIPTDAPRPGASADAPGGTPAPTHAPEAPAPGGEAAGPAAPPTTTPAPGHGTSGPPAPSPTGPADDTVCLPVIGLCVDLPLTSRR